MPRSRGTTNTDRPPGSGRRESRRFGAISGLARHVRARAGRVALTATCLLGAGTVALAAPTLAAASLDYTAPQWAELGTDAYTGNQSNQVTAVYTIQNVAESGTQLLEDRGNAMGNGSVTDVWQTGLQGTNQPTDINGNDLATPDTGPITQANYLWEYVPDNPSAGASIVDGPGELINRQSGLCLDAVGTDPNYPGPGTAIDQWTCNSGANQQWVASPVPYGPGTYSLTSEANPSASIGVGTNSISCSTQGDGDPVHLWTADTPCDHWKITKASYDFGSHTIQVKNLELDGGNVDHRGYSCAPGWEFRQGNVDTGNTDWGGATTGNGPVIGNASDPDVNIEESDGYSGDTTAFTTTMPGSVWAHYQATTDKYLNGQMVFYCDPVSGTL